MRLYEGIGLLSEKHAVVLDIGTAYTKCGFAAETGPRCIIRSEVTCTKTGQKRTLFSYKDAQDLNNLLVDFMHNLYFRHLLVNPKDRRVVIVESLLRPTVFRETLAKVLFCHYEVLSLLMLPSSMVSLCTLGITSALVVDIGYDETIVMPVIEGVSVLSAAQAYPIAGKAIDERLEKLLKDHGNQSEISLHPDDVEDIKVRTCFTTTLERGTKLRSESTDLTPPPSFIYPLRGDCLLHVPGKAREESCEVLFDRDNEMISLSNIILNSISKCPIDTKKWMCENIVITGGTSVIPGLKSRINEELKYLLQLPKYKSTLKVNSFKYHTTPAKGNYASWLGGAIYSATDAVISHSITKDQYQRDGGLPDWVNLKFNTKEKAYELL